MSEQGTSTPKAAPFEGTEPEELLALGHDLDRSLNFRIRMAQILSFRHFEKQHPGYGGASRFLGLLSIIKTNPGAPQNRLAEAVGLQRSSLVPILDRMETEGIVERRDVEGDRRAKAVFLTAKGEGVVADLSASALESERRMSAGLTDDQVTVLIDGLDRIIHNLRHL
ncbi:MarR family transcriptional regulator [Maritimibacter sp. UBA3975]|uniref:MarR family winged helix-turn-helix transcriptional regulator n=1 Tax=Maritimibacter sp. UBA3975 TaxID=1946833 RepID=UPI0025BB6930|nr:MarR family transcriptional regulator [Maritimibacter sp. UBA3975]|tara:strand:- start:16140 stop:16643 length:504 start_codon:yes stop_codon:yes gene_type:complete